MERFADRTSPSEGDDRGLSPQVGFILLFGLVIMGAALVYVVGIGSIDMAESQVHAEQTERELRQFDADLESLEWRDDTPTNVYLGDGLDGELVADGRLTVTASDGYVDRSTDPIDLRTLVVTDEGGNEFAYQAGGIWRIDGERATSVSPPEIDYDTETVDGERAGRVDIAPVTLAGAVGTGEHTVRGAESEEFEFGDDLDYVSHVTIEIAGSSYDDGWYDYLKEEFEATDADEFADRDCEPSGQVEENVICHDESEGTVTVVATVDGETEFENLVDIEPTVHGGLYLEGSEGRFNSSLSVAAYDGADPERANGTDLFVANYDRFEFGNGTALDGMPVVNGDLASAGDPSISRLAYGAGIEEDSNVRLINESEAVYALDAANESFATELASPYEGPDAIDAAIDRVSTAYLAGEPTASGDVTAGLYGGTEGDIDSLNSSSGDVHVAADGGLELSDVRVTGDNRTSVYVDGTVDLSDVDIESDRADSLWVYATSESTVTISDDFQGVVYAPGADLEIADGVTIDGAVVAGDATEIGDGVRINFDTSLRSATPLSEADQELSFEYGGSRAPLDVTFVLDRSGSMGPHNPNGDTYSPLDTEPISEAWQDVPMTEPFRVVDGTVQLRDENGTTRRLDYFDSAVPDNWEQIRVHPDEQSDENEENETAAIGRYNHPGNDPTDQRVTATKRVIDELDADLGDRVGVYDFARSGRALYSLGGNLTTAKESVVGTANGGTNMAAGLRLALDDYEEHGTDDRERIVILLSDGENNNGWYDYLMDRQVDRSTDLDFTLHTVGLNGLEHDSIPEEKLEGWANATGGNFYQTADPEKLLDLFVRIAEEEFDTEVDTRVEVSVTNDRETTDGHAVRISERTVEIDA